MLLLGEYVLLVGYQPHLLYFRIFPGRFGFWDRFSLCSSGWPETCHVEQVVPKLGVRLLPLPPRYRDYRYRPPCSSLILSNCCRLLLEKKKKWGGYFNVPAPPQINTSVSQPRWIIYFVHVICLLLTPTVCLSVSLSISLYAYVYFCGCVIVWACDSLLFKARLL